MTANYLDRWPPHVEKLKALWLQGYSASQIASMLNRDAGSILFSRNAVIGKLHRLHMSAADVNRQRATYLEPQAAPARPRRAPPAAKAIKTPTPTRTPPPAFVAPSTAEGMAITDLKHFHCRHPVNSWPKGYGDHARFCGKFAPVGPYCIDHTASNIGPKPEPKPRPVMAYDRFNRRAA